MELIVHEFVELVKVADSLPIVMAVPVYGLCYCVFLYAVLAVIKKAKDVFK